MMRFVCSLLAVLILAGTAWGEETKPEDLKKLYSDTLQQLRAAQDRKTELATQNDKLTHQVAALEKTLGEQTAELNELKRQSAAFADKTFFLRTYYAAWEQFIAIHPAIKTQWDFFLANLVPLSAPAPAPTPFMDPDWPLSARG
jgi:septal ring factor EnvC (AmiA/AmiB activator)